MKYHCNKCKRTLFEDDLASDECRFCGEPYFEGEYREGEEMNVRKLALERAKNHAGYIEPVNTLTLEGSSYYYGFLDGFTEGQMKLLGIHDIKEEELTLSNSVASLLIKRKIAPEKLIDLPIALDAQMQRNNIVSQLLVAHLGYHKAVEFYDEVAKVERQQRAKLELVNKE